jgi:hypothetical protein
MGSHPIEPANWSFECIWSDDCGLNGSCVPTKSQPGTVRRWQSGTEWGLLSTGDNSDDWAYLDTWLDLIAQRQPTVVMYTFGLVPCWISTAGYDGKGWGSGHNYSPSPPSDLTSAALRLMPLLRRCATLLTCRPLREGPYKVLGDVERGQSYSFLDRHRNAVV